MSDYEKAQQILDVLARISGWIIFVTPEAAVEKCKGTNLLEIYHRVLCRSKPHNNIL